ncbi:PhoU domain protein (plasmid) [Natronomonas pharaonis DSM 2160]|uniref:PhoU domain protein n=1 Tax=Natronomonas pharaonis (strain ATCC 35678 / DSM 2160 / CIP 103997 / JCM 8858 / NBRC 14720 / NCIMB 2260 / Gabara) TaxID=348780 RepID=Q3IM38_NATPD|nr:phosphate uptake regulator PhoU [Natronomonas pharaonis]CAI50827.1 PhoU domain protein [Natronomonas pharaonis DSM 2160]
MTDRTLPDGGPIERKVQVTGGSTYTVSIPKFWANDRDIGSGSPVYLYPFDDRLVVARPDADGQAQRTHIDVDTVGDDAIKKQVEAAYAAGVDEIAVTSDTGFSAVQRRTATRAITNLVGMEIASETERELLAKSLLDPAEISLDDTVDQIRQIALSMHENAVSSVLSSETDEEMTAHIISRDDDVDRLFALVSRQFCRILTDIREVETLRAGRRTVFTQFRVARQLERIADHAERIADVGSRLEAPPSNELASAFEAVAADARRVVRTALDGNTGEALLRRDSVDERIDELDRRLYEDPPPEVYLYGRLLESIRRTAGYGGNIAEIITLDRIMGDV